MKEKLPITTTSESPSEDLQQRFGAEDLHYDHQLANSLAATIYDFAQDIGKTILSSRSSKYEIFSPASIVAALNLVLLGSKGKTFSELMTTLGYAKGTIFNQIVKRTNKTKKNLFRFKITKCTLQSS